MPRAIVYGRHDPGDGHYQALLAMEPGTPSEARREELRLEANKLAGEAPAGDVQPLYLARIATEPNALASANKADWWMGATEDAAAGVVAPTAAVKLTKAAAAGKEESTDGYLEKLAKYIPAESLSLTLLAFAALGPTGADIWWLVVGGALANVIYLYATALHARKETPKPRWYFYPLSAAALVLWAIAVIEVVGKKAGIEGSNAEVAKTFVLAMAAFFIPLVDSIGSSLSEIREEKKAKELALLRLGLLERFRVRLSAAVRTRRTVA